MCGAGEVDDLIKKSVVVSIRERESLIAIYGLRQRSATSFTISNLSNVSWEQEAEKQVEQLIAFAALPQDLSSVASTHIRQLTTSCESSSRGSDPLLCSTVPTHRWHTYTDTHIHINKIHIFKYKNNEM